LLRFGVPFPAGFRFELPFGAELLSGLADLLFDFGSGEEAAEGGVRDVVVARERPQRLTGPAAPKQLRVRDESTRPRPARERPGLRLLVGVVVERSREDHGVDLRGEMLERW